MAVLQTAALDHLATSPRPYVSFVSTAAVRAGLQTLALPLSASMSLYFRWADPPRLVAGGTPPRRRPPLVRQVRRRRRQRRRASAKVREESRGVRRREARRQNSPSVWKSTWPPTRRIFTPSGWLPSLSSTIGSVERLAGEGPGGDSELPPAGGAGA